MKEERFGTIRNNTALKQSLQGRQAYHCFGTIRNNTALKHNVFNIIFNNSFGTIRNNTALKLRQRNRFLV